MEGGGEQGWLEGREGSLKGRLDESESLVFQREVRVGSEGRENRSEVTDIALHQMGHFTKDSVLIRKVS